LGLSIILATLSIWSWQKWDAAWIERSESFFPTEWQDEEMENLAWKYPIYRSNDTYQWVHVADALAQGNSTPLYHRFDEGLPEGRPNRWHSGLARLLSIGGSLVATIQDWPAQRGIHHLAHWLGTVIHISAIILGSFLISLLAGKRAALLFAGLFFLNAAIAWDFAFSRLDHEAALQFCFLLHLIGLAGLCSATGKPRNYWALLAGISAGFCWWISATVMSALSVLITLGLAIECYRRRKTAQTTATSSKHNYADSVNRRKGWSSAFMRLFTNDDRLKAGLQQAQPLPSILLAPIATWGGTAAGMIGLLCLLDGRFQLSSSIATIHPIFILAQLGAALFCLAILIRSRMKQAAAFGLSLTLGLSPALWLFIYRAEAHPWLNPMMHRLHDYIVEFQSPFSNSLWNQAESLQAAAIALLALCALSRPKKALFISLVGGLLLLALLQARWLGLLATVSTTTLCLQLKRHSASTLWYVSLGLLLLSFGTWAHKWSTIEAKPGKIFVTDLMLHVGARDINLNLQRLSEGETIHVAMPYAFAATSALFPEVHPIGTFYWENDTGIEVSADFFAGIDTETRIDFAVVQGGRQGAPFAKIATWTALGDDQTSTIEQSLSWKLSAAIETPLDWQEMPWQGTFTTEQFSVRIFSPKRRP
jgi:hypothetical protein